VTTATHSWGIPERSSLLTWAYRHIGRSSSRTVCPGMSAIRADPAFHTWAQLIASRNAGTADAFLFHGTRSEQ
jgi:hypothetical protein